MTENKKYRTGLLVLMELEQTNGNNPLGRWWWWWWWWINSKNNDDDDNLFVYVYCKEGGKGNVCLDVPQKHQDIFDVAFICLLWQKITSKYAYFNILGRLDINFRFVNPQNPPWD
jgi:hypothetical protein